MTYHGTFPITSAATYRPVFNAGMNRYLNQKPTVVICTYVITCTATDQHYVGSTQDFYVRWKKHAAELTRSVHTNDRLQDLFHQHPDAFTISILRQYDSTVGLESHERADALQFENSTLLNYRVGHNLNGDWLPIHNQGRRNYKPKNKRGRHSGQRWFDHTGARFQ